MKNWKTKFELIYGCMVLFTAGMIIWAACEYKGIGMKEEFFGKETVFASGWYPPV